MATKNTTSDDAFPQTHIYTRAEVAKHAAADDLWVVIHRKVYNLSSFLLKHPGGGEILIEVAGEDVTEPFEDLGHSSYARKMMVDYEIGEVEDEPVVVVDKTRLVNAATCCDDWQLQCFLEAMADTYCTWSTGDSCLPLLYQSALNHS